MKKEKNKFIIIVICIITLIILIQIIIALFGRQGNTDSFVTIIQGSGTLNEEFLELQEKYMIIPGDTIRIIGDTSLGIVEWGDGSLTRLGGNTKILIDRNEISHDYSTINISFQLLAGKTWSNVVSFIGKDSSFTQNFEGIEAGVRGTIFDVDLDNDYIHVSDHQVTLSLQDGQEILISEGKAFDINNFSLIELGKFLQEFQDTAWVELNEKFDSEYLGELQSELKKSAQASNPLNYILPYISQKHKILSLLKTAENYSELETHIQSVSHGDRDEVYKAVLEEYQKINFVGVSNYEFYKRKLLYKKALIDLGNSENTQILVETSMYDLEDIFEIGDFAAAADTLQFLQEQKESIPEINLDFITEKWETLPDTLQDQFIDTFENIGSLEEKTFQSLQSIESTVQNFIESKAQNLLDQFVE